MSIGKNGRISLRQPRKNSLPQAVKFAPLLVRIPGAARRLCDGNIRGPLSDQNIQLRKVCLTHYIRANLFLIRILLLDASQTAAHHEKNQLHKPQIPDWPRTLRPHRIRNRGQAREAQG
jgi:hypothetical protein